MATDPVAQYKPRTMLAAMRLVQRPSLFLSNMFVKSRKAHRTQYLEINKIFGDQVIATYGSREGHGKVLGTKGYEKQIYVTPYVKERLPYSPDDVDIAPADGTIYDDQNAQIAELVSGWLMSLEDRFDRLEELQVAQSLQTGKVLVDGTEQNFEVDYQAPAGSFFTLTGDDQFDDAACLPLDLMEEWSNTIIDRGGRQPDVGIQHPDTWRFARKNAQIKDNLDNRRTEVGQIAYRYIEGQRATVCGRLQGIGGLDIVLYVYQATYDKEVGGSLTRYKYMNDYSFLLTSTAQDFRFHYGRIHNFKSGNFVGQRFPSSYEDNEGEMRVLKMESAPLAGHHEPESTICATVKTV